VEQCALMIKLFVQNTNYKTIPNNRRGIPGQFYHMDSSKGANDPVLVLLVFIDLRNWLGSELMVGVDEPKKIFPWNRESKRF
jgi:hypothetical protein